MSYFYVTAALPKPAGKDRTPSNRVTNEQLNGEWIEFMNITQQTLSLEGVRLSHYTFDRKCDRTGEDQLQTYRGGLEPRQSIRVHTGSGSNYQQGSVWHFFLGRSNYVWNNVCGDTVVLRDSRGEVIDWASYNPDPSEGEILHRVARTNHLE